MLPKGKVFLIGAGPGDPGLITVKGLNCVRHADVIVYDHLANQSLLGEARKDAELIYVGKSSAKHTMPQEEINCLLVKLGLAGKYVVRLKGGDPFVFGRGGEEVESLVEAGLEFEVVPGISAAVAVPAYAGIPITHRKVASSFAVITGHEAPGKGESSIAWDKLATGVDTLVFLMGVANLGYIVKQLKDNGRPGGTPVAVIREGTLPVQRTVVGTLYDIEERVDKAGIKPPAVIVVGEVVGLRETMRWFDKRPLFGKKVLVTRTREQASKLSTMLEEMGAEPVELPTIAIEAVEDDPELDRVLRGISGFDWVFFTSANAVNIMLEKLARLGIGNESLKRVKVGAIGPATAEALAKAGLRADYVPKRFVAEGILEDIARSEVEGKNVLLPRADIARADLSEGLERLGATVRDVALYRTVPAKGDGQVGLRMLKEGQVDVVTFTSSSTVTNLVGMLGKDSPTLNKVLVACIGPVTAATARGLGVKVDVIATEHTITGLVKALAEALASGRRPV
ncbi:MAG: uroporphyrinogen-III C-methyltransferase [Dehalococcoidia bacterium]|nr:uroporphyrinogen-III C-methyltransferase [Dehalococcoidia bacterium]